MTIDISSVRDDRGFYPDDIADVVANANPEKYQILRRIGRATFSNSCYKAAWKWMEGMLLESGTLPEASCGLLYGISGVGKSTVLRKLRKAHGGPLETEAGPVRPVVRVSTPSDPTWGTCSTPASWPLAPTSSPPAATPTRRWRSFGSSLRRR